MLKCRKIGKIVKLGKRGIGSMGLSTTLSTEQMSKKHQTWTKKEITYLKKNFGKMPISKIAADLDKSYSATHYQLKKMGLTSPKKKITEQDHAFILNHWLTDSVQEIATHLQTTPAVIYRHAKLLGLEVEKPTRFWTVEEEAYLVEHWEAKSVSQFAHYFDRSEACVRKKAESFGLKRYKTPRRDWSKEDLKYLKKSWGKEDVFELAKVLDRTPEAIRKKAAQLNLKRLRRAKDLKPWTPEEESFLIEHWHSHTIDYLTRNLKKSKNGVYSKAHRLKLGPKFDYGYTAKEAAILLGYADGSTVVRWIDKGWLKAGRTKILKNDHYCISDNQLKTFMKAHQNLWSFETIKFDFFHDSNASWIAEKRKADRQKWLDSLGA